MKPVLFGVYALISAFIGQELNHLLYTPMLYALVTLPGTFFHECAHYGMALILDGHPTGMHLIPEGNTLGYVLVQPNWYNAAPIGCAPLLLMPLTGFFLACAVRVGFSIYAPLFLYFACCAWAACIPSGADFSIALSQPLSWLLAIPLLLLMSWIWFKISLRLLNSGSATLNRRSVIQ